MNNSDMQHNKNCFNFLLHLQPIIARNSNICKQIPQLAPIAELNTDHFDATFAYGDLYTTLLEHLENELERIEQGLSSADINQFDELILAIYQNEHDDSPDNQDLIKNAIVKTTPSKHSKTQISSALKDSVTRVNAVSPQSSDKLMHILMTTYPNYKPQNHTNLPSIRNYSYKTEQDPIEYRFGTQAQRHQGKLRISPIFQRWQYLLAKQTPDQPVAYVYFNNLKQDHDYTRIQYYLESLLGSELYKLEDDENLKTIVITLPAIDGLFSRNDFRKNQDQLDYNQVYDELLQVALGNPHSSGSTDFKISPKAKALLFGSQDFRAVLEPLLKKSFATFGLLDASHLSTAQKQAVWLHFTKFEFPDLVLRTLKPKGYNFTCKDGIDRGAISSAYYNLIKSIEVKKPLSKEEFNKALHLAAANVRGRGLNFHQNIIWNAIDAYVKANYANLLQDPQIAWLISWRDMNCPHERVAGLLALRINQCRTLLDGLPSEKDTIKRKGLQILEQLEKQQSFSGQRLMLEVVVRTAELATATQINVEDIDTYNALAEDLVIKHPILTILAGLLKAFLGALLLIPSLGYSQPLIYKGIATAKSGFFATQKQALHDDMLGFGTELSTAH